MFLPPAATATAPAATAVTASVAPAEISKYTPQNFKIHNKLQHFKIHNSNSKKKKPGPAGRNVRRVESHVKHMPDAGPRQRDSVSRSLSF